MKYKPSRDIPRFAREYKTTSPSKLADIILRERNEKRTPQSITVWFKTHPEVLETIESEIHREELDEVTVSQSVFENGTFEELPSVKNWLLELGARELAKDYVKHKIWHLKQICTGKAFGHDFVKEGKWNLRHPDYLTLKHVMQWLNLMKGIGADSYRFKRDLKDFLQSKGIATGKKIVVGKPKGYGKYKDLYAERPQLDQMLAYIKERNFEVYVVDNFMFRTGTRLSATLNAKIEKLEIIGENAILTVYDKGRRSKYPEGKPHKCTIRPNLLYEIRQVIGNRTTGKIFTIDRYECSKLNKEAIKKYCPNIIQKYPNLMPNHFWRHMYYQYILRKCDWNYTVAADLGGSTPQSVRESYGMPPEELIKQWSNKYYID